MLIGDVMLYFSSTQGPNSDIYMSLQIPHTHAEDIVNFEVWQHPLPHAYHIVKHEANTDIILFSYNSPPNSPSYCNDLMTLNDYWIRVDNSTIIESGQVNVPELSTGLIFAILIIFIFAKNMFCQRMSRVF